MERAERRWHIDYESVEHKPTKPRNNHIAVSPPPLPPFSLDICITAIVSMNVTQDMETNSAAEQCQFKA